YNVPSAARGALCKIHSSSPRAASWISASPVNSPARQYASPPIAGSVVPPSITTPNRPSGTRCTMAALVSRMTFSSSPASRKAWARMPCSQSRRSMASPAAAAFLILLWASEVSSPTVESVARGKANPAPTKAAPRNHPLRSMCHLQTEHRTRSYTGPVTENCDAHPWNKAAPLAAANTTGAENEWKSSNRGSLLLGSWRFLLQGLYVRRQVLNAHFRHPRRVGVHRLRYMGLVGQFGENTPGEDSLNAVITSDMWNPIVRFARFIGVSFDSILAGSVAGRLP